MGSIFPQLLVDQLTLFEPGGAEYPHHNTTGPLDVWTVWLCNSFLFKQLVENFFLEAGCTLSFLLFFASFMHFLVWDAYISPSVPPAKIQAQPKASSLWNNAPHDLQKILQQALTLCGQTQYELLDQLNPAKSQGFFSIAKLKILIFLKR